ncbi:MAG: 5-oxoprolinase subunit PxpA [Tepidisphaeraceae bacterium]
MPVIDLNCDLGEGFSADAALMPLVSSVNIACGGHAGDDETMRAAVALAKQNGVNIGAHPGYEDRENFGRVFFNRPLTEVVDSIASQIRCLVDIAAEQGLRLTHVKPHGALYHAAGSDALLARRMCEVVRNIDPKLAIVCPAIGLLGEAARQLKLRVIGEGFVDRRYRSDGTLVPRSHAAATLHDPDEAAEQAIGIILNARVTPIDGPPIRLEAQTLCVHGDGDQALATLTALCERLRDRNITVQPFGRD